MSIDLNHNNFDGVAMELLECTYIQIQWIVVFKMIFQEYQTI